jgi:hypothetical protein
MDNLKKRIHRFMMGRYGNDALNTALLYLAVFLNLLGIFVKTPVFGTLSLILLVYINVRFFSKNLAKRYAENQWFMNLTRGWRRASKAAALSVQDREHRYLLCPSCRQICRIPKGRGKVELTCPACKKTFDGRS